MRNKERESRDEAVYLGGGVDQVFGGLKIGGRGSRGWVEKENERERERDDERETVVFVYQKENDRDCVDERLC